MDKNEQLTIIKSIGFGIAVGIGLLLLNLSLVVLYMSNLNSYLYRLHLSESTRGVVMLLYLLIMIGFFPFSYYYAGKYCGKRWKKPSWEWGFWLTLPIIGFIITEYIRISTHVYGGSSQAMGGALLFTYTVVYFVILLVSSYGSHVGAKSVQQKEKKSE